MSFRIVFINFVLLTFSSSLLAQTSKGFLVGNVLDPGGVLIEDTLSYTWCNHTFRFRGDFAANYDFSFNNILTNTAAKPNSFGVTNSGACLPADTDPRGVAKFGERSLPTTGTPDPFATINTIPSNLVNPQTYVYNFDIQRELPFNLIADVAYVGSRGTRLFVNEQQHQLPRLLLCFLLAEHMRGETDVKN